MENKLMLESVGLSGIKFSIGNESKIIDTVLLNELTETIIKYIEYTDEWSHFKKIYKDFNSEEDLERSFSEDLYHISHSLQSFISDPIELEKKLKEFNDIDIIDLDITRDMVYSYIKDKDLALAYSNFCYNEIIKPIIDTL